MIQDNHLLVNTLIIPERGGGGGGREGGLSCTYKIYEEYMMHAKLKHVNGNALLRVSLQIVTELNPCNEAMVVLGFIASCVSSAGLNEWFQTLTLSSSVSSSCISFLMAVLISLEGFACSVLSIV